MSASSCILARPALGFALAHVHPRLACYYEVNMFIITHDAISMSSSPESPTQCRHVVSRLPRAVLEAVVSEHPHDGDFLQCSTNTSAWRDKATCSIRHEAGRLYVVMNCRECDEACVSSEL